MGNISRRAVLGGAMAAAGLITNPARSADTDFFEHKTMRLLVGIPPGGAYDLVARIVAAHWHNHIPGNPSMVVENMPGASSLTMTNYLYNSAPKDGTIVGFPMNSVLLEPSLKLISRSGGAAHYDLNKMSWLGSPGQDPTVVWVAGDSDVKTFADLRKREVRMAATSPAADSFLVETLAKRLLDANIKIVAGYQGVAQYVVAFEQGEIEGAATTYAALMAARPDWVASSKIRLLAQFGAQRNPSLPDIPTGAELAETPEAREMLEVFGIKFNATYPVVLGPDVPADRVAILHESFDKTMQDPAYKEQIAKLLSPQFVDSQAIGALIGRLDKTPPAVLEKLRQTLVY